MTMAVWQQVLALDAKFNAYRSPNNPQFRECARQIILIIYALIHPSHLGLLNDVLLCFCVLKKERA